jgi:hypothetical protein
MDRVFHSSMVMIMKGLFLLSNEMRYIRVEEPASGQAANMARKEFNPYIILNAVSIPICLS